MLTLVNIKEEPFLKYLIKKKHKATYQLKRVSRTHFLKVVFAFPRVGSNLGIAELL